MVLLRYAFFTVVFGLFGHVAQAQSVSLQVDRSFTIGGHGQTTDLDGLIVHSVVTYHKVIEFNGRAYICLGYIGFFPHQDFLRRSKVVLDREKPLKAVLHKATFLSNNQRIRALRQKKDLRTYGVLYTAQYPADLNLVLGEKVNCIKSRTKWKPEFNGRRSKVIIPSTVWIQK